MLPHQACGIRTRFADNLWVAHLMEIDVTNEQPGASETIQTARGPPLQLIEKKTVIQRGACRWQPNRAFTRIQAVAEQGVCANPSCCRTGRLRESKLLQNRAFARIQAVAEQGVYANPSCCRTGRESKLLQNWAFARIQLPATETYHTTAHPVTHCMATWRLICFPAWITRAGDGGSWCCRDKLFGGECSNKCVSAGHMVSQGLSSSARRACQPSSFAAFCYMAVGQNQWDPILG